MYYVIYHSHNGELLTVYEGNSPPLLTPYIEVSEVEFNYTKNNLANFFVEDGCLKSKSNHLFYIRLKRDWLLANSDKYMLLDYPITDAKRAEWQSYRQQLRDFPTVCDPLNPAWPLCSD